MQNGLETDFVFGYIRPLKAELLVREYEQYRGVYCALCKSIGKRYGAIARMALSYDGTFLALVQLAGAPDCPGFQRMRCVVNPLKRCTFCTAGDEAFAMAAAFSVISAYWKIRGDLTDAGWFGKLRAAAVWPFAAAAHRKVRRAYPQLEALVQTMMKRQAEAEKAQTPSLDAAADPTAQMLSELFAMTVQKESQKRVFAQFGYFLGRWVYLMDAADDLGKDVKSGSYNPFVQRFRLTAESPEADWTKAREFCNQSLNESLWQAVTAMNLMEFLRFGPIIENIVAKGLPEMQRISLFTKDKKKGKMHVGSI